MYRRKLLDYIQPVLRTVREYQALSEAEAPETGFLYGALSDARNDLFVSTSTENGVARREKVYKIVPPATFTLNERKFTLSARIAERLPYTYRRLEAMLEKLCGPEGYKINLDSEAYTINVLVALSAKNNYLDVGRLLRRVSPANLVTIINIWTWEIIYQNFETWEDVYNSIESWQELYK